MLFIALALLFTSDFERPPDSCLDMDDPRIQNEDDPRRKKYKIEICCLAPDDPRAQNPDDPRRKKYRDYGVRVCGPDIRALTIESQRRHALKEELTELQLDLLARDGSKQRLNARAERTQDKNLNEKLSYRFHGPSALEGVALLSISNAGQLPAQQLYYPAFGVRPASSGARKERFADTDYLLADLARHDPSTFDYYFREREGSGEDELYVYSALPRDELGPDYPYYGQSVWLRARDLVVVKIKMFDRSKHPWKEMRFEDVVEVAPGVLRANTIVIEDLQRRHRTIVRVTTRTVTLFE